MRGIIKAGIRLSAAALKLVTGCKQQEFDAVVEPDQRFKFQSREALFFLSALLPFKSK